MKNEIIALIDDPKNELAVTLFRPNNKQYRLTTPDNTYTMTQNLTKEGPVYELMDNNGIIEMSNADMGEVFHHARVTYEKRPSRKQDYSKIMGGAFNLTMSGGRK